MNRHQRRALERKLRREGKAIPNPGKARADGRPQYYDIAPNDEVECVMCQAHGITVTHRRGEAYLNDPANSPVIDRQTNKPDAGVYIVCKGHIPDNAVIYDPIEGTCRNKAGDQTWVED